MRKVSIEQDILEMRSMDKILVTNIQRMCFHDGPGIRTVVFFKGCNLHCPWCSNPENISFLLEDYSIDAEKGVYGKYYSSAELYDEILKDKSFYGEEGGVTFSGGEPLLFLNKLTSLLKRLKKIGLSVAVETALQVSFDIWKDVIELIDHFIVDLKLLDPMLCRDVLGGDTECYRNNIDILKRYGKDILFRIPLNHEYTMKEENLKLMEEFFLGYRDVPVEIFATHGLGAKKYKSLGREVPVFEEVSDAELKETADRFRKCGCIVSINSV